MNYPPQGQMPPPPQKKGMTTTQAILLYGGLVLVSIMSTCGVIGYKTYKTVKQVENNIADGSALVLFSPPDVVASLANDRKDYVGSWRSVSGKSTMLIQSDGRLELAERETSSDKEKLQAPIAAFAANDMIVRFGVDITVRVTQPPFKEGDHWKMVANDITFHRPL